MARNRRQLTLGVLRAFTAGWPDDTPLAAGESEVNPDEPKETQEFIVDDTVTPIVALDNGGGRRELRLGYVA